MPYIVNSDFAAMLEVSRDGISWEPLKNDH